MIRITKKEALYYAKKQNAKIYFVNNALSSIDAIFYNSGYFGCNFWMSKAYFHNGKYIIFISGYRNTPTAEKCIDYETYKSIVKEACHE